MQVLITLLFITQLITKLLVTRYKKCTSDHFIFPRDRYFLISDLERKHLDIRSYFVAEQKIGENWKKLMKGWKGNYFILAIDKC